MDSPDDPQSVSGMPYAIKQQLLRLGHTVVNIVPGSRGSLLQSIKDLLPAPARDYLRRSGLRRDSSFMKMLSRLQESRSLNMDDKSLYRAMIERARDYSSDVQRQIDAEKPPLDAIMGVCISLPLYNLNTAVPIIYFSDTTATLIMRSYPQWRDKPAGWRRAAEEIERSALARVDCAVFATDLACKSAVEDFSVAASKVHRIPLGANVTPNAETVERAKSTLAPSKDNLRLVICAADPHRKQLDLAIDTCEELRKGGVAATLSYIGPPTPRAIAHPYVHCAGRLHLSSQADRLLNTQILADSHVMLLPSLGEAFGISVVEAAHLGKPSVVSDAGGLPEVVDDGFTGRVLPVAAGAIEYADAVRDITLDPERYRMFSDGALNRARATFHWDHFGDRLSNLLHQVTLSN
jgi:glycosyltransferase involved in cell wall biosynthesis